MVIISFLKSIIHYEMEKEIYYLRVIINLFSLLDDNNNLFIISRDLLFSHNLHYLLDNLSIIILVLINI